MMKMWLFWDRTGWLVLALGAIGCGMGPGADYSVTPSEPGMAPSEAVTFQRVVPKDERPVNTPARPPAPISGGTLLVTRDGKLAIAADSQRDRLNVVQIDGVKLSAVIPLEAGDEPGRLVEDGSGRLHVVLRRAGAVVTIDPTNFSVTERRNVCAAPRGIAFDKDRLHVACAEGKLVTLPLTGTPALRLVDGLPNDLRDVVVQGAELIVSRFRSGELLRLDAQGKLLKTHVLPDRDALEFVDPASSGAVGSTNRLFRPAVAWRMAALANGDVAVMHQLARTTSVDISPPEELTQEPAPGPYGGSGTADAGDMAVVHSAITVMKPDGSMETPHFGDIPLPVDVVETESNTFVIAAAGAPDPSAPQVSFVPVSGTDSSRPPAPPQRPSCGTFHSGPTINEMNLCGALAAANALRPQTVAIATNPLSPQLLVTQTYDPSALNVFRYRGLDEIELVGRVALAEEIELDSGHALFHRAASSGIACASCHPEAGDDGVVWRFDGIGMRRTQPLDVGLEGTAPFHWEGEHGNLDSLLEDTFVSRMGGVHESAERTRALETWLFEPRTPKAPELDTAAVERGRKLFESDAECASCHTGSELTNNQSYDVRRGMLTIPAEPSVLLQVPSLRGLAYRTRLMHDGCAQRIEQRFEPSCGGSSHGNTSALSKEQLADLVVYLKSL